MFPFNVNVVRWSDKESIQFGLHCLLLIWGFKYIDKTIIIISVHDLLLHIWLTPMSFTSDNISISISVTPLTI